MLLGSNIYWQTATLIYNHQHLPKQQQPNVWLPKTWANLVRSWLVFFGIDNRNWFGGQKCVWASKKDGWGQSLTLLSIIFLTSIIVKFVQRKYGGVSVEFTWGYTLRSSKACSSSSFFLVRPLVVYEWFLQPII